MTNDVIAARLSYDEAYERVEREVGEALVSAPRLIREYTGHLALAQGKFIRTRALLACAMDENGMIHENAVCFSKAVELVHLATLVHDDVIDDADLRRGQPTLQKKYGKRSAVICGDYLLCMALRIASGIPNREEYVHLTAPDYIGRVCLGELAEHLNNRNFQLTVYQYLRIIGRKTAALFEASFFAGAILCTKEEAVVKRYARLGRYIGMIFQLTDDCIDYEGEEASAKKPVRSDYDQGVVTVPLIYALGHDAALKEEISTGRLSGAEVARRVAASGGPAYAKALSRRYYAMAWGILEELELAREKWDRLKAVLDKAYYGLKA